MGAEENEASDFTGLLLLASLGALAYSNSVALFAVKGSTLSLTSSCGVFHSRTYLSPLASPNKPFTAKSRLRPLWLDSFEQHSMFPHEEGS
jgi:hypothetical protein